MTDLTRHFCSDTDTHVRCALCKGKAPAELMIKFKGGFVHYLCDARERIACGVGPREEQECKPTAPVAFERPPR